MYFYFLLHPIGFEPIYNCFEGKRFSNSAKDVKKLRRALTKEDLQERESLSENITVDQIDTLKAINKTHADFISELKQKPKLRTSSSTKDINKESTIEANKFEDTMNLFD